MPSGSVLAEPCLPSTFNPDLQPSTLRCRSPASVGPVEQSLSGGELHQFDDVADVELAHQRVRCAATVLSNRLISSRIA